MATPDDLAIRVLRKLQVLGVGQSAQPDDKLAALEKVSAVHASIQKDKRASWTLQRVPTAAEEPYVLMAAFLLSSEYPQAVDTSSFWTWGEREINAILQIQTSHEPTRAEYF